MKISINKLERHGFIVDVSDDVISIYPEHNNTDLFDTMARIMVDYEVVPADAYQVAEIAINKIIARKIMRLCEDD